MTMAGCLPLGSYVTAQQAIDAAQKGQLDRRAEEVYTVYAHSWPRIIPTDNTFVPEECSTWVVASGVPQRTCTPGAPVHYTTGLIVVCGVERIAE
ncbi:MAG TPA: hypothetical protein VJZ76_21300 [Thermoanaerobaculia bacterium]|nr:hypothetical protein [Thermoanaerobaculia bacterium]